MKDRMTGEGQELSGPDSPDARRPPLLKEKENREKIDFQKVCPQRLQAMQGDKHGGPK